MGFKCLALAAAFAAGGILAYGASNDALLDKLVEKGVLTQQEAKQLQTEAENDFSKSFSARTGMPDWVTALKFNGDFRGRYEGFYSDNISFPDRNRFRYRMRFGITALIKDNFEVGLRLASGEAAGGFGGDPISGNTTFRDNASKKFVYLDLAYGKWHAIKTEDLTATAIIGKMENPFVFSEMLFDPDYTPEGIAQQWSYKVFEDHTLKAALGGFALEEVSASSMDSYLLAAQLRHDAKWNKEISSSFGVGILGIAGEEALNNANVPNINVGNSRTAAGNLAVNYNPVVVDGALTYTLVGFPGYRGAFPVRALAEYINNLAASQDHEGYAFGVQFGKAGKKGQWEVGYKWKTLEGDAWYEEMVDSDFGGGLYGIPAGGFAPWGVGSGGTQYFSGTNTRGHQLRTAYSPYDSITLGVAWALVETINEFPGGFDSQVSRFQVDATWKF